MKRVMAVAAVAMLGMSSAAQATTYVSTGFCSSNQSNLFAFTLTGGYLGNAPGPYVIKDLDGFISGAHPGQGIRWEVFAFPVPSGDPATDEAFYPLIYGYTVADFNGIAPVSVHFTSTTGPFVGNSQVGCLHLVPTGRAESLQVTLTLQADPPPSTTVASQ
jgi:hypothetical protein